MRFLLPILLASASAFGQTSLDIDRDWMLKHDIEGRGVTDPATLAAMRAVPRHEFVPPNWVREAYTDRPLPIGYGQTISQPYMVAYMTEVIQPKKEHRVLEIGAGSGYHAAVIGQTVDSVFTIEIIGELASIAKERLARLEYGNIVVRHGDGYFGWEEKGPFDAIVVTAAAEHIPPPLIEQLKDGGRMVIPVGTPFRVQTLMLVEKNGDKVSTRSLMPVRFVPLTRGK
jgi:protein-L-isoaspartate(D-aspartate) O-methyltransferase